MDVTESARIDELRRRVQKDPTSIAFAQLAEEYRRIGDYQEAVNVCRAGLIRHPAFLSARVTLGRALMELGQLNDAHAELQTVLDLAPDNLGAIRVLAEIHQRRGESGSIVHMQTAPVNVPREAPPVAGVDDEMPALDALEGLTLDLPPTPDFSSWNFETVFSLPEAPTITVLPDEPAIDPSPGEPAISSLSDESTNAQPAGRAPVGSPGPDRVLDELQHWLAAIVEDRASRR
jgi:tetratricopeptide (TPR) repeat protein